MQRLNFGRIESLRIIEGEPVFDPPPRIVQKLKLGADNAPRPEAFLDDFWLKSPVVEMLKRMREVGEGTVLALEVKHGLPFSLEVESSTELAGARRA
jgi:hypothetical protein